MSPRHTRGAEAHAEAATAPACEGKHDAAHDGCLAVREVLNRVGDKWSVLVVRILGDGPRRFTELLRDIEGLSQRMLTRTLRGLERDGLVSRTVTPSIPPRVDYALTDLGRTLLVPIRGLARWAQENRTAIQAARDQYDAERGSEEV